MIRHLLEIVRVEMVAGFLGDSGPVERGLHRETVHDAQVPHDNSARSQRGLLYLELTGLVRELTKDSKVTPKRLDLTAGHPPQSTHMVLGVLAEHHGKDVLLESTLGRVVVMATVDEHVVLSA